MVAPCGLSEIRFGMKREKAARDRCQQEIMQQIVMQVFFMGLLIAGNTLAVEHFDKFVHGIEIASGETCLGDHPVHDLCQL